MLKKSLFLFSILAVIGIAFFSTQALTFPEGAPAGVTGSPADGKNCTKCHEGLSASQDGWIKSTIDSSGYVPGKIYTITAISTGLLSTKKFGFEISPQDKSGNLIGTLIVTNDAETQLVGKGKYITHKEDGITANGSKTWKFNWQAPVAGTGDVTFYGAFVLGPKPYGIITSTLKISEQK